jgi:molybdate transport system substrate-binding protein
LPPALALASAFAFVYAIAACAAPAADRGLTVFAASSLRDVAVELGGAFEAARPGVRLTFSFDATNALRAQIEQGARADVFMAADETTPLALADAGLVSTPSTFAGNRLAIVTPLAGSVVTEPADLARPGVRIVAAAAGVPITGYAEDALGRLARLPGHPDRFAERVQANVVSHEDNVRAVLAKVELGEGDAAIVYATDAASSDDVHTVAIPAEANVTVPYSAAAVTGSHVPDLASAFVKWLDSPEAQARLRTHGFVVPAAAP